VELFELAGRVRGVLKNPLRVENVDLSVDVSVGIAVCESADTSALELLRRPTSRCTRRSRRGSGCCASTWPEHCSRSRLRRGGELRQAIAHDQLVVWYQPQVDTRSRQVVGMEALVRWKHPTEGLLMPMTFLPDARRSGLNARTDRGLMRRVVADARGWLDAGFAFRVALKCAPPELVDSSFLSELFQALDLAGLPGDTLVVEITGTPS